MAYEVLARKWRPRQFDDVVGQAHVTETLKNAIATNRIAHAYLFVGPRGIGKTSVARIFAKALNCAEGSTVHPCDKCDSCLEIAKGTNLDVIEIDGASTGGVEEVRSLRETLKYAPTKAPYKIYIIDEVHMLSSAAFNALLKTLEEPPPHVKFEFATTEPQKILPTIISRCQRFDLRRIPVPLIIERLQLVARDEQVEIADDALLAIARGAEGGLRDAESALDQLISFKGKTIDESDVLSVFGLVSRQALEDMVSMILQGNIPNLIRRVAKLDEEGKDLQRLVFDLMDYFKNLLICHYIETVTEGLELAEVQIESMKRQVSLASPDQILRTIGILMETEERMRYALLRRTLLETALIRCARAATAATLDQVLEAMRGVKDEYGTVSVSTPSSAPQPAEPAAAAKPSSSPAPQRPVAAKPARPAVRETPQTKPVPERSADEELDRLKTQWSKVRERAGKSALPLRKILADAVPLSVEGDRVVVGFDAEFVNEIDIVKSGRNRTALERALTDALGRKVLFEMRETPLDDRERFVEPKRPVAAPEESGESGSDAPDADQPETPRADAARLLDDPAVQKTLDMFDAKILDVRS